jgi:hypothetical protein
VNYTREREEQLKKDKPWINTGTIEKVKETQLQSCLLLDLVKEEQ